MYQIKCDDYILYDHRDERLVVLNPKCKLEVNTCGSASFTILSNHPYYGSLKKLKSIFEIQQDGGVIFRGRMTSDSRDFYNQLQVDLEGVLAFTNDSIISPFNFPEDFTGAADAGNVVEFFLGQILTEHNAQVEPWQQLKLGIVTVADPNNYITRSSDKHLSTWEVLKTKLFESALGGYLCIRYESDGNYVDYLSEFPLTNTQTISFGENLLSMKNDSSATETYSAILPVGKDGLTLDSLENGDLSPDLVKKGNFIYSKSAVADYGWVCVPIAESTWSDVTEPVNLQRKAMDYLTGTAMQLSNTITAKAVDLHFTDEQIQSFRIYRNVLVNSPVHGVNNVTYPLLKLDIDILNPQNTDITVGKTTKTLVDINGDRENNVDILIQSTVNNLRELVSNKISEFQDEIEGIDGLFFYIKYSRYADGHEMTDVPTEDTEYMGTCSTSSETAPVNYTEYTWCKIRGNDGATGSPGAKGDSGETQYLHIKYSNDGKTFTGRNGEDIGAWIGTLVDFNAQDSTNFSDYTWKKFTGDVLIGGRNLLLKSDPSKWFDEWQSYHSATASVTEDGWLQVVNSQNEEIFTYYPPIVSGPLDANQEYIISFDAYSSTVNTLECAIGYNIPGGTTIAFRNPIDTISITDQPTRYSITLKNTGGTQYTVMLIGTKSNDELNDFYVRNIKLEKGNTPTDWTPAPEDVDFTIDNMSGTLHQTILDQRTEMLQSAEEITLNALADYVTTSDYGEYQSFVTNRFSLTAEQTTLQFERTESQIQDVNGDLQQVIEKIYKNFEFTENGLVIKSGENAMQLLLDNDIIRFTKNGQEFGWWDGVDFHTGNIIVDVNEKAQFGNFAFVPRSDGSLSFLKVGG